MNWDAIGAIGQMLGSVVVLVTLGYLATQISQVRIQMVREASKSRWDALRDIQLALFASPDYLRSYDKAARSFAADAGMPAITPLGRKMIEEIGIPPEAMRQFNSLQWALWFYREQGIELIGDLAPAQRIQFEHAARNQLSPWTPERAWYGQNKPHLNPDAVCYIDDLLAQPA